MTKMISLVRTLCVTAIVSLLAQSVWAAVPVAVWEGDFSNLTQDTLTIDLNGNTRAEDNSYLQIKEGATGGILINDTTSGGLNIYTMILKCSGINLEATSTQVLFTSKSNTSEDRVGVDLPANNAACRGVWGCADWTDSSVVSAKLPEGYTSLVYNHQQSGGTFAYAIVNGSASQIFNRVGLRASSDIYTGIAIGGLRGTRAGDTALELAVGMKITAVAIFKSTLTTTEMATYRWPSETVTYTGTVADGQISWDKTLPASPTAQDYLVFTGSGDAPVPANYASFGQITIGEGVNLTGVAPTDISNGKFAGAGAIVVNSNATITVPSGITVKARGDIAVTLTNNGTFDVESGTCNVSRGSAQSVKGVVNIAKNATYVSKNDDSVPYNDGSVTINVRGTLDFGTTRWTVGSSDVINCYGGCTVTAANTNNRAIDLFRDGTIINVIKVDGESTNVSLPALSPRKTNTTINIASGMTVSLEKPIAKSDTDAGLVNITGGGKLSGTVEMKGVAINLGSTNTQIAKFVAVSDTNTIKWTGNGSDPICNNDSKDEPFITIDSGATLQIYGHDYSGWNGGLRDTGWIVNNGTLVFQNDGGSRFWRDHIVLGPNSTMKIDTGDRDIMLYGGVGTAEKCQIMLESGTATIQQGTANQNKSNCAIRLGNDQGGGYGTKGAGIYVGDEAVLTISVPLKSNKSDPLSKYGEGTLVFSADASSIDYNGTVTLAGGTIKSTKALTVTTTVEGKMVVGDGSEATPYALAAIVAKIGTTPYASVQDAINALTGEQTVADITIVDAAATIPSTHAKVTKDDVTTLRTAGEVHYISGYLGTSDAALVLHTANGGVTTLLDGDTIVIGEKTTVAQAWMADTFLGKTFKIEKDFTLHAGTVDAILDDATVTVAEGKTLTLNNTSSEKAITLGSVTLNGAVKIEDSISATAIDGTCTITLSDETSLTITSKGVDVEIVPSSENHKIVIDGTKYTSVIKTFTITIKPVAHTTVTVDGEVYAESTVTVDYGTDHTIVYTADEDYVLEGMASYTLSYITTNKIVGSGLDTVLDISKLTTVTESDIQVSKPAGSDSIVVEGEGVVDNTKIPFETGIYTVKAKKGEAVVASETLGVIAAKKEEAGETPAKVTTAVAVPFTGATVANLLNTALLSKDDTLTAYISGKYEKWTLGEDKTWSYTKIVRVGGEGGEDLPVTTALARGSAVWVTTAGKVVVLGKYNEETEILEPTTAETHLLANPTMSDDYEPEAVVGNEVQMIGEPNVSFVKSETKAGGTSWRKHTHSVITTPFGNTSHDEVTDEDPKIPVGKGFWFIKR